MSRRFSHACLAVALAALLGCATTEPDLYADRVPLGSPRVVPFDLSQGVPIIEVEINGQGPFRLVFDTGASMLALDESVAERLALPRSRYADPGFARSLGGHIDVYFRRVERLRAGTLEVGGIDAMIARLSDELGGEPRIDGLFGLGAFYEWVTTVDYEAGTIRFADGPSLPKGAPGVLPVSRQFGLSLFVEARFAGRSHIVRLDTGAGGSLIATDRFVERLDTPPHFVPYSALRTPSGLADAHVGRLSGDLVLGPHVFRAPIATLARSRSTYLSSHRDYAALLAPPLTIGTRFLAQFRVVIDQRSARVQLERRVGAGPIETLPIRTVLLRAPVRVEGDHLLVVDPRRERTLRLPSASWHPALRPGDRIIAVDGVPVAEIPQDAFHGRPEGTQVPVWVRRDERTFEYLAPIVTVVP